MRISPPLRFFTIAVGLMAFTSVSASAACPVGTQGMSTRLILESTGLEVSCVYPDSDYRLEVQGPSNNSYYCIAPPSGFVFPTSPIGFVPIGGCRDAIAGDLLGSNGWPLRTNAGLNYSGIQGGLAPGGCVGSELNQEHTFSYPRCLLQFCTPPPNDLKLWLPLDEHIVAGSQSGTTFDISGQVGGFRQGPQGAVGRFDLAMRFDGINDKITFPNANRANIAYTDFTIDVWVKTTDSLGVILAKRDNSFKGYLLSLNGGRPLLQMGNGVFSPQNHTNYQDLSSTPVDDGQWHLIAVTVDRNSSTGGKMYVDGELSFTFNPTGRQGSLTNSAALVLGMSDQQPLDEDFIFEGVLDEVEIFDRALSQAEIRSIFRSGKCKTTPPPCGDGVCSPGESCLLCQSDCGPCNFTVCGNGVCETGESCSNCSQDCGACGNSCGDGLCSGSETCATCSSDCGSCLGCNLNGVCEPNESSRCPDCCTFGSICFN